MTRSAVNGFLKTGEGQRFLMKRLTAYFDSISPVSKMNLDRSGVVIKCMSDVTASH
jgi:hypothetical protein